MVVVVCVCVCVCVMCAAISCVCTCAHVGLWVINYLFHSTSFAHSHLCLTVHGTCYRDTSGTLYNVS